MSKFTKASRLLQTAKAEYLAAETAHRAAVLAGDTQAVERCTHALLHCEWRLSGAIARTEAMLARAAA